MNNYRNNESPNNRNYGEKLSHKTRVPVTKSDNKDQHIKDTLAMHKEISELNKDYYEDLGV